MNQLDYANAVTKFGLECNLLRLELYKTTGYEWMVVPKTGALRSIAAQHGLFIQPTDGIDNDHDGKIDEDDEFCTKADGGQSPHNFDLARDVVPMIKQGVIWWTAPKPYWDTLRKLAEAQGLVSGQSFKGFYDAPHVEAKDWRVSQAAWRKGEIIVG